MIYCIVQYQSPETKIDINEYCKQPGAFIYGYDENSQGADKKLFLDTTPKFDIIRN